MSPKSPKKSLAATFAVRLRAERAAKHLSQNGLAEKAGISVSYVSMLERGNRTPPLETVEAIAGALRVPPLSLLSTAVTKAEV